MKIYDERKIYRMIRRREDKNGGENVRCEERLAGDGRRKRCGVIDGEYRGPRVRGKTQEK